MEHPLPLARALVVLSVAACLVGLAAPPSAAAPPACAAALSPDDATRVFRALRAVQDRDGCHLEGVDTRQSESTLRWTHAGAELSATLRPSVCAGEAEPHSPLRLGAFDLIMAPADRARCPSAVAALTALLTASTPTATQAPPTPSAPTAHLPQRPPPAEAPLALTPVEVSAPPPPDPLTRLTLDVALPALWLLLLALGTLALARAARAAPRQALLLAAIAALAVALRVALPPWGPGLDFDSVEDAYARLPLDTLGTYGRAPEALLQLLFFLFPANHDTFIVANLVAAVVATFALAGLATRLGWPPATGAVAALLLATAPLAVRFGPTYNRFSLASALTLTAFWAVLAWLDTRRASLLLLSAAALALAAQCRPELLYVPAFAAALPPLWHLAGRPPLSRRHWLALAATVLVTATLLVPQALAVLARLEAPEWSDHLSAAAGRRIFSPEHNALLDARYTPLLWPALAALGLLHRPAQSRGLLAWVAALALFASAVVAAAPHGQNIWGARYHLAALPAWLLLAAAGLTGLVRGRWLYALAPAVAALSLPLYPSVLRETTLNHEYRFLRQHLAEVPDDCVILTFDSRVEDLGLRPNLTQSLVAGRHHRWRFDRDAPEVRDAPCLAFYLSAACDADTDLDADNRDRHCAAVLDAPGVRPLAVGTVPAASSFGIRHRHAEIPVGLYLLRLPADP